MEKGHGNRNDAPDVTVLTDEILLGRIIETRQAEEMDGSEIPEYSGKSGSTGLLDTWIRRIREQVDMPSEDMSYLHHLYNSRWLVQQLLHALDLLSSLNEKHGNLNRMHFCASSEKSVPGGADLSMLDECPEELKRVLEEDARNESCGPAADPVPQEDEAQDKKDPPGKETGKGKERKQKASFAERYRNAEVIQEVILLPESTRNSLAGDPGLKVGYRFVREELVAVSRKVYRKQIFAENFYCKGAAAEELLENSPDQFQTYTVVDPVMLPDGKPGIPEDSSASAPAKKLDMTGLQAPSGSCFPFRKPATAYVEGRGYSAASLNGCVSIRAVGSPALLPGSSVSSAMIASLMCDTVLMSLPAYRMSQSFRRNGTPVERGRICSWMIECSKRFLEPVAEMIKEALRDRDVINADETPGKVLKESGKKPEQLSYYWIFLSDVRGLPPLYYYLYSPTRSGSVAGDVLKDFIGYLLTDRYAGYNGVGADGRVIHVYCFAHLRRRLLEACGNRQNRRAVISGKKEDLTPAEKGYLYIQKLFELEKKFKNLTPAERKLERDRKTRPVLDAFWDWISGVKYDKGSRLEAAVKYALDGKEGFNAVLLDGRVEISNNAAERCAKGLKIGEKNWLFRDTVNGARAIATMETVMRTAEANGLEVEPYIRYLLDTVREFDEFVPEEKERRLRNALPNMVPWSEMMQKMFRVEKKEKDKEEEKEKTEEARKPVPKPVPDFEKYGFPQWMGDDYEQTGNYFRRKAGAPVC